MKQCLAPRWKHDSPVANQSIWWKSTIIWFLVPYWDYRQQQKHYRIWKQMSSFELVGFSVFINIKHTIEQTTLLNYIYSHDQGSFIYLWRLLRMLANALKRSNHLFHFTRAHRTLINHLIKKNQYHDQDKIHSISNKSHEKNFVCVVIFESSLNILIWNLEEIIFVLILV